MSAGSGETTLVPTARGQESERLDEWLGWAAGLAGSRVLLWATVIAASCLPWMAHRLPMVDLPQHAGQIALWRDLIGGASPWGELLWINWSTPYLLAYALVLPLAQLMNVGSAMSVVLSITIVGFVWGAIALRRELGADPRLDWLSVTPFFGISWQWGFFPFLVATPLVMLLVLQTIRYVRQPSVLAAASIVATGLVLFLAHGIAFMFAGAVSGAVMLAHSGSVRRLISASAPFAVLGAMFLAFTLGMKGFGAPAGFDGIVYGILPPMRLLVLFAFSHAFTGQLVMLSAVCLLAPFAMGLRPQWRAAVPFGVLLAWTLVVPFGVYAAVYLYERFGMFGLPFLALMFARPAVGQARDDRLARSAAAFLVLAAWTGIATMAYRIKQFDAEARDFEVVLAAAEPGKRAMSVIGVPASEAAGHPRTFMHFPMWYQVEKKGLVDFSFAAFPNIVVRYRSEAMPAMDLNFSWRSDTVEWQANRARDYDYFFVRHGGKPVPTALTDNPECRVEVAASAGAWTLLRRGLCRGSSGGAR